MNSTYQERLSDSSYVDRIGQFRAETDFSRNCHADILWNILLVKYQDKTSFSVWGPMKEAGLMNYPEGAEFLFIVFKLGTFMPRLPINQLVSAGSGVILPDATSQSFWLDSSAWQYPDFDNADTFVDRLVRGGLLMYEPVVESILDERPKTMPSRTARHRFLRATGLTKSYIHQVERAKHAVTLLEQGVSILDTVYQTGYADQAHLTRSFKRLIGQSPAQIAHRAKTT
jgi:AraC-like DNA-binding protein